MDAPKRVWAWITGIQPLQGNAGLWRSYEGDITDDEYILAAEHDRLMAEKDAEISRLREALTPSAETKAAYWSEVECDCPTETWRHYVPWTSIKQIMKMIRARAALKGDSDE